MKLLHGRGAADDGPQHDLLAVVHDYGLAWRERAQGREKLDRKAFPSPDHARRQGAAVAHAGVESASFQGGRRAQPVRGTRLDHASRKAIFRADHDRFFRDVYLQYEPRTTTKSKSSKYTKC